MSRIYYIDITCVSLAYRTGTPIPREFIGGYCSCAGSDIYAVPMEYWIDVNVAE